MFDGSTSRSPVHDKGSLAREVSILFSAKRSST
jgi:hypothetical protein